MCSNAWFETIKSNFSEVLKSSKEVWIKFMPSKKLPSSTNKSIPINFLKPPPFNWDKKFPFPHPISKIEDSLVIFPSDSNLLISFKWWGIYSLGIRLVKIESDKIILDPKS